ncbi:cytochrome P450, partial [Sphaerosporella brunnea]
IAVAVVATGIRNVYFHPISKIPGPKLAAFNRIYFSYIWLSGRYPQIVKDLHDKYGPVVRLSPNQVSFNTATSWKDIYGHVKGRKQFLKSDQYDDDGTRARSIVTSRDPAEHGKIRKLLSNAFSAKALTEQEDIVHNYVDLLIKQLHEYGVKKDETLEMNMWYHACTFDIIGDLAFGDSFGSLETGKQHFWVSNIPDFVSAGAYLAMLNKWIGNGQLMQLIKHRVVPKSLYEKRKKHLSYSEDKIISRMNATKTRKDFMSKILSEKEAQGVTVPTLISNSSTLVIAGSETTASFLSGTTYSLCRNPRVYKLLAGEIRSSFSDYSHINGHSTESLPYLKAVIEEGLRTYPPTPFGMGRFSPGETVDGIYIAEGIEVFTSSWSATHSEDNFHRPYEFIPERWLDKGCTDKKEASQPFLLGTRVCLGRNLAMLEMRVILAKMLWAYDMTLQDDALDWVRDSTAVMLWRKPDLPVKFTRREGVAVPPLDG